MITLNGIPKFVTVQLSDKQWEALARAISEDNKALIDDAKTRGKLDTVINVYLWSTFNDRQGVQNDELKKPFEKLITRTGDLMSFFEDYFFPTPQKYSDQLSIEIIERRYLKSKQNDERPLLEENSKIEKNVLDYSNATRNNLIRHQITTRLSLAANELGFPSINMETLLRGIYELNRAANRELETIPSATGKHGDLYFNRLITDAQGIYCDAGKKGFYTQRAISFMELFIEYVTEFARCHIGADHAASLEELTENGQLIEWIRKARTSTIKEEKKWKE